MLTPFILLYKNGNLRLFLPSLARDYFQNPFITIIIVYKICITYEITKQRINISLVINYIN